eukprot:CAMPEP_0178386724 /NCGR_PEP_ID=MMETSP0689_2-20121128/8707_1 /TAXON_ID=160604 /ORGANISM="Amphidinium massartii, Strain CS-259" /LENGTH=258 /DNA_ID=CAMNT_0020007069 /DNA_START=367 /DNA_END=1140 /DNA_ORIENTATION=+
MVEPLVPVRLIVARPIVRSDKHSQTLSIQEAGSDITAKNDSGSSARVGQHALTVMRITPACIEHDHVSPHACQHLQGCLAACSALRAPEASPASRTASHVQLRVLPSKAAMHHENALANNVGQRGVEEKFSESVFQGQTISLARILVMDLSMKGSLSIWTIEVVGVPIFMVATIEVDGTWEEDFVGQNDGPNVDALLVTSVRSVASVAYVAIDKIDISRRWHAKGAEDVNHILQVPVRIAKHNHAATFRNLAVHNCGL